MANINDENKELMASYPNVRRIMISTQTFTLEEVHQAIQDWIKSLRQSGNDAALARIKYATMNPDTSQAALLKLVRLAIGSCANERIRNESMTNIVWPISFTQDLLGLLTAIDYDISAVEEVNQKVDTSSTNENVIGQIVWDILRKNHRNPVWFGSFKNKREFAEIDQETKTEFHVLAVELWDAFNEFLISDDYEF